MPSVTIFFQDEIYLALKKKVTKRGDMSKLVNRFCMTQLFPNRKLDE